MELSNKEPITAQNLFKAKTLALCAMELEDVLNQELMAVEVHA